MFCDANKEFTYPIGSILRCYSGQQFFYILLVHYSKLGLETPIYALKNTETGIANNCSKEEFYFQHFYKFTNPSDKIEASHITGLGGKRFNRKKPNFYDHSKKT